MTSWSGTLTLVPIMQLSLLSLLCLCGCASRTSTTAEVPSKIAVPAVAPAPPPEHMLFRVTGGAGATVYVLGSVHLLPEELGKLPWEIDSAFARAKTVAFETSLDTLQMRGLELFTRAKLPAGTTLKDVISAKTYAGLEALAPDYSINFQQLTSFKPWMVSLAFTQAIVTRAKFKPQYGVDMQLNQRAKTAGKRVVGLEPVEFQLQIFDKLSIADQEVMLASQLISPDSAVRSLLTLTNAWASGDTATVNRTLNASMLKSPTLFALFLIDRNLSWMPSIEALLNGRDDALVVVGTAHLVGSQGVLELLRRKGYRVERF